MTDMIFSMSMRFTYIDVFSLRNYYEFSIKKFVFQKYFYIINLCKEYRCYIS